MSYVLVFFTGLIVPEVRRRLGWRGAILGVQSAAVVLLALMGLTELWRHTGWAFPVAVVCFIFRQPLTNMSGPSTSELSMTDVDGRNRELMSACGGAIWSGAWCLVPGGWWLVVGGWWLVVGGWWLAARVFEVLRAHHLPYWQMFLATAVLYFIGTFSCLGLIRAVEKRESKNVTPDANTQAGLV